MVTQEFLEQKVKNLTVKIPKMYKRIERLKKEMLTYGPGSYGYDDRLRNIRRTEKDILEAQTKLVDYQKKLTESVEKKSRRNIPVITEFLNRWEDGMIKYFEQEIDKYVDAYKQYYHEMYSTGKHLSYGEQVNKIKTFKHQWGHILQFYSSRRPEYIEKEDFMERMKVGISRSKLEKYDFIVARTMDHTGPITDASGLHIGKNGELNGIIKGPKGTVSVQTIGAGGWNIQRYHFRTLIHKIK